MNEFFELLHHGRPALAVFAVDVAVFIAAAVVVYALVFLARYNVTKLADQIKGKTRPPKYLNRDDKTMWSTTNAINGDKKKHH